MQEVVIVIHLLLAIAIVILVLLQRSEGGALGMGGGGGGGGMGGFLTGREAANILTRATAVLAAAFMVTSLVLTILANPSGDKRIVEEVDRAAQVTPQETDSSKPSVPDSN